MLRNWIAFHLLFILLMNTQCDDPQRNNCRGHDLTWNRLPPLPDGTGFAGSFAGLSNGALLVAGGSNFPGGGAPWKGSAKKWYDKIFVLDNKEGHWKETGKLPVPLGYGVSITTKDGLVIVGGSNSTGHVANVWRLRYKDGLVQTDEWPSLPFPLANACGAILDNKIFIAGGLVAPGSPATSNAFLMLDLSTPGARWKTLPAWPGPSRMLAVAGAAGSTFYLFSGTQLVNGQRKYLADAYAYTLELGWKVLAALPQPVAAAPSPAYHSHTNEWMIFGGDDGALVSMAGELKEKHPGFSDVILQYNAARDRWQANGKIYTLKNKDAITDPNNSIWAPVTTPMVVWDKALIFPGGEVRPATRTPNVLVAQPCD